MLFRACIGGPSHRTPAELKVPSPFCSLSVKLQWKHVAPQGVVRTWAYGRTTCFTTTLDFGAEFELDGCVFSIQQT